MPRKTAGSKAGKAATRKRIERKTAGLLAGVLVLAVLTALTLTVPGFTEWAWQLLGISRVKVPVVGDSDSPVAVHFIDVGQGDAALIEDNGAFALIDGGPPEAGDDLVAYLRLAGVQRLDILVMTHPHADHYGGLQKVVERFDVAQVVLPNFDLAPLPTTTPLEQLLQALVDAGVPAVTAYEGLELPLGQGSLTVVHAGLETGDNHNLLSVATLYAGDGMRFLNTGDGEKANERAMLADGAPVEANLFMAAHHGSSTSNLRNFLRAVAPRMVVVSCAAGNSYGHPHRSALEAYTVADALVLRTDQAGSVVVKPDGEGGLVYGTEAELEAAA
ncbi:MAG: MBL fold metallo-hydrolase [Ruminococcaceae bacterium]|nr:MBL fold metallo-hydrolase [Oscillospiraceae bacterium]